MCSPTALAITGIVATLAGTGVSMYGQYQQGQSQKQAAQYQAQVDQRNAQVSNFNAQIAQQNANEERAVGREQERRQRLKTAQIIGQQKVAMAANGIDISSGIPIDIIDDTAQIGEMDALMIRYDSDRRAKAYETQSINFQNQGGSFMTQSNMYNIAGNNAANSGLYSAGAVGLGGLAQVSSKWLNYSNPKRTSL